MKRKIFFILTTVLAVCFAFNYIQSKPAAKNIHRVSTKANSSEIELAKKYIKLSETYRVSGDYENAFKYLDKSAGILSRFNNGEAKYWKSVVKEYYAYIYSDLGKYDKALISIDKAIQEYEARINQIDGSPLPLKMTRDRIKDLTDNYGQTSATPGISGYASGLPNVSLNLNNQNLKDVPSGIDKSINNLSLGNNRLKSIPGDLSRLNNLEYLDLSNNKIREVRIDFSNFPKLRWLNLSANKIKNIDESIGSLGRLEILDLSANNIKNLPLSLHKLKNLKILNLKNNRIPFEQIANIIKSLPNTNILYDKYELKSETIEE